MSQELLSPQALEAALREIGRIRYHNLHPSTGCCTTGG